MWTVYMLRCGDGSIYTGIAADLEQRLAAHRRGTAAKYTRGRQPLTLVYQESQPTRGKAQQREYQLKQLPRRAKLALIAENT